MHRCFLEPSQIFGDTAEIFGQEAHHISKVLRVRPGEEMEISDGERYEYKARITSINKDCIKVNIVSRSEFQTEPKTKITLYQCLPKAQKMELIIQKAVELGVSAIIPVASKNCVVKADAVNPSKIARWQKIAYEAAKQCARGIIPAVEAVMKFEDAVRNASQNDRNFLLYEKEQGRDIKTALGKPFHSASVFIGPEGGFDSKEAAFAAENGMISASLGKRILRTETAGIAAIAVLMYHNNEMK